MTHRNNVEYLPVTMTMETVDNVTQTTSTSVMTSSSSRGIEFYFQCAVIVIGVVGTAANALILYAMVASKQHKKHVLIFNQNATDLFSCFFLMIIYVLKLVNFYFTGLLGYCLCVLILSENLIWCAITASKANLIFVTIERYLKVVYPVWSKKTLRNWMIYSAMAIAWISGFVHMIVLSFYTSVVINGVCYGYALWNSQLSRMAYTVFYLAFDYVVIIIILTFCYWRILIVIRRQAQVMAGHGTAEPSTAQARFHQIQSNVIKTMILVSAFYAITDLPISVYILVESINDNFTIILEGSWYATLFVSFFYFCANPFIYATKFDPVKNILLRLVPCKKTTLPATESIDISPSPN